MLLQQFIQFIIDPANNFGDQTRITLALSVLPTALAIVISVPLGILAAPRPIAAFLVSNLSGLARAIPTLALLGLMLSLPHLGLGFRPSVVALTLLGIPPILLNTIAGLRGIDPAAIDAARGMGMTNRQVLVRVQIPLVLPILAGGIRTAAVQIVATTPLASLIGAGGYGDYILQGLGNQTEIINIIVGSVCVALLALIVEFALAGVQRAVTPVGLRAGDQQVAQAKSDQAIAAPEGGSLAA